MPNDWKKYGSGLLAGLLAVGAIVGVRPSGVPEIPAGSKIEQVDEGGVRRIAVEGGYLYQWGGSDVAFVPSSR